MLDGEKKVKLIVQDSTGLIFFPSEEPDFWQLPTSSMNLGKFPEQVAGELAEKEFGLGQEALRLLKVIETEDEQAHLFLVKIEIYQGPRKVRSIPVIEARDLKLSELDRQAVNYFENIIYRPWGRS